LYRYATFESFKHPYEKGTNVIESELTNDAIFVKLYREDKYKAGEWLMSIEDFKALNMDVNQLKDVFSLPSKPLRYSLVKVPKGTKVREGTAGKIWVNDAYWGHGGGKQYQIMEWDNLPIKKNDWFSKEGVKL
jgi:hypothetical protein